MAWMNVICPRCGADVQIKEKQEAAVCKYCGIPFVVAKAKRKAFSEVSSESENKITVPAVNESAVAKDIKHIMATTDVSMTAEDANIEAKQSTVKNFKWYLLQTLSYIAFNVVLYFIWDLSFLISASIAFSVIFMCGYIVRKNKKNDSEFSKGCVCLAFIMSLVIALLKLADVWALILAIVSLFAHSILWIALYCMSWGYRLDKGAEQQNSVEVKLNGQNAKAEPSQSDFAKSQLDFKNEMNASLYYDYEEALNELNNDVAMISEVKKSGTKKSSQTGIANFLKKNSRKPKSVFNLSDELRMTDKMHMEDTMEAYENGETKHF